MAGSYCYLCEGLLQKTFSMYTNIITTPLTYISDVGFLRKSFTWKRWKRNRKRWKRWKRRNYYIWCWKRWKRCNHGHGCTIKKHKVKSSVVVISGIPDRPFGPVPGVAVRRCCRGSFLTLSSFADLLVFFGSCRCLGFPRDSPSSSDLWGFPRDSPGALFWILFP